MFIVSVIFIYSVQAVLKSIRISVSDEGNYINRRLLWCPKDPEIKRLSIISMYSVYFFHKCLLSINYVLDTKIEIYTRHIFFFPQNLMRERGTK